MHTHTNTISKVYKESIYFLPLLLFILKFSPKWTEVPLCLLSFTYFTSTVTAKTIPDYVSQVVELHS